MDTGNSSCLQEQTKKAWLVWGDDADEITHACAIIIFLL
jgi:hypothetical protein